MVHWHSAGCNAEREMTRLPFALLFAACALFAARATAADTNAGLCSELGAALAGDSSAKPANPAREPTKAEAALVAGAKLELLGFSDYAKGVTIVDIDNDGKEDILAWNISGSGRYVMAEAYELAPQAGKLVRKFSIELGILQDPRFVRVRGTNYAVATDTGDTEGLTVSQVSKAGGEYRRRTLCRMETKARANTDCRHPACRDLARTISDPKANAPFTSVEWPHKYFGQAGLSVYFPEEGSQGDFDNTGKPTTIWRFGRDGYINQHIYWGLLGQGEAPPDVDPKLRPTSEGATDRKVLPGAQHARLRRTLDEQGKVLTAQLGQPVSLPGRTGQFFLFNANNRTYWAWDFGQAPFGEAIHITYTNARKSDYIGKVAVRRDTGLRPCTSKCSTSLEP